MLHVSQKCCRLLLDIYVDFFCVIVANVVSYLFLFKNDKRKMLNYELKKNRGIFYYLLLLDVSRYLRTTIYKNILSILKQHNLKNY